MGRTKVNRTKGKQLLIDDDLVKMIANEKGATWSEKLRRHEQLWTEYLHVVETANRTANLELKKAKFRLANIYARRLGLSPLSVSIVPIGYNRAKN